MEERPGGEVVYTGVLFHDLRRSAIMVIIQGGAGATEAKRKSGREADFEGHNVVTEGRVLGVGVNYICEFLRACSSVG